MKSRMIVHLMSALVLASALAGCLDLEALAPQATESQAQAGPPATDTDGQHQGYAGQNRSQESEQEKEAEGQEEPQENSTQEEPTHEEEPEPADPPVAVLLVENESTTTVAGQAPLTVPFELMAEYEDLDDLQWTLSPGDGNDNTTGDGHDLPYRLNHTYEGEGTFHANYTVYAGGHENTSSVLIEVEEAAPELPDPVLIEGEAHLGNPAHEHYCARTVTNSGASIDQSVDGDIHALDPAGPGWVYAMEPAGNFTLYWYDSTNRLWITDEVNPDEESPRLGEAESTGSVPEDASNVEVCMDDPADSTPDGLPYTLTLWPPGHPEAPGA